MLHRAKLRFRTPLPPKNDGESSISLFVRHARASKAMHDKLEVLNQVLKKDFPVISTLSLDDTNKHLPLEFVPKKIHEPTLNSLFNRDTVEPSEVNNALNIALCMLGCPKSHYFDDMNEAQEISKNAATSALEWRVSSLCSELGAKAYKYAKSRMCRSYSEEDMLFSAYVVTDEMPLEDDSDYEEDDDEDISIDPSEMEADEDMTILDKASLVMQYVVLREQKKTRRTAGQVVSNPFGLYNIGQASAQHTYASHYHE